MIPEAGEGLIKAMWYDLRSSRLWSDVVFSLSRLLWEYLPLDFWAAVS